MAKIDSITSYQGEACKTFKQHRTLTPEEAMLLDWTIGLPGEVGEVCELIKHNIFHGEELDLIKLTKELGDVMWYISAIAKTKKIPMDAVLGLNVGKLQHRYDNGGFDATKSEQRHQQEKKFEETAVYKELRHYILEKSAPAGSINILLIGNECTGKTTLANILSEKLGMGYYKGTHKEDNKLFRATSLICKSENVIFDRLYFPDEIVYREVKNDPLSREEYNSFMSLSHTMKKHNFVIIFLEAQIDVIIKRLKKRGDDYIDASEIGKINAEYAKVMQRIDLPIIYVDTSVLTMEELVPTILKQLEKIKKDMASK